jgi:hypothetical protein
MTGEDIEVHELTDGADPARRAFFVGAATVAGGAAALLAAAPAGANEMSHAAMAARTVLDPEPCPWRPVKVYVDHEIQFNLEKMFAVQQRVLGLLGCPGCYSGFAIEYGEIDQFVVSAVAGGGVKVGPLGGVMTGGAVGE